MLLRVYKVARKISGFSPTFVSCWITKLLSNALSKSLAQVNMFHVFFAALSAAGRRALLRLG